MGIVMSLLSLTSGSSLGQYAARFNDQSRHINSRARSHPRAEPKLQGG